MSTRLIILSGPSGVGKDTLIEAWRQINPTVERVVACTTRPPRVGERDGVDYRFLSDSAFEQMAAAGQFLEFKEVHGNMYGTPRDEVARLLADQKFPILKIDVQGALEVMDKCPGALSIFVMPPSIEELERRIRARASESDEQIAARLAKARFEMALADSYDAIVTNDSVAECAAALDTFVRDQTGPSRIAQP